MKQASIKTSLLFLSAILIFNCSNNEDEPEIIGPPIDITIDKSKTFQTIDGFGFFGAQDVWWAGNEQMWSNAWGEKVIDDLGLSIWRNEYFPPATASASQDANWSKQKPVVEGLKTISNAHGVNLKFVFTVWSPPADLKWQATLSWAGDQNATRNEGAVSTKNGGTLNPNKYNEFAQWLNGGIQLYKDLGIDLYGVSLQNEPMFKQSFNSCQYTSNWYNEMMINVVPKLKSAYPNIKIFGSENMLDMEGATKNFPFFYHNAIKENTAAGANIDILAVHGYNDGLVPTTGTGLVERWNNHRQQFSEPMNKPTWMSETSGYTESWKIAGGKPGPFNLAMDIHAALFYGNASAWIWWQGSDLAGINDYSLMQGTIVGKKYYVSKHFYRFIRPGAVRVSAGSSDQNVLVTGFQHINKGTFTIIIINTNETDQNVKITGADIPSEFNMFLTDVDENCKLVGSIKTSENVLIPKRSIVTLQAGGDPL